MRVLVLGGAGQEGTTAVRRLGKSTEVTEIIIANLNEAKAQALAAELGRRVRAAFVDIRDTDGLTELLRNADVVLNFVGPYFLYQELVLRACIEIGVNYVDISDDWEPTVRCLDLTEEARSAGITAIVGMGGSPGTLNLLTAYAIGLLDEARDVEFRWVVSQSDVDDPAQSAATRHGLHMVEKPFPTFRDGRFVDVDPFSEPELINFRQLGEQEVFNLGHPEPLTLPRYFPTLRNVSQKGSVPGFNELWKVLYKVGLTSPEALDFNGVKIQPQEIAMKLMERMDFEADGEQPPALSESRVTVRGVRDGEPITLDYVFIKPEQMSQLTGIPAYISTLWVGLGVVKEHGVFAPEGCFSPRAFLAALAEEGFVIEEKETAGGAVTTRLLDDATLKEYRIQL